MLDTNWLKEQFNCSDYFDAALDKTGFYDKQSCLDLIYTFQDIQIINDGHFLEIGRTGCDGVTLGYRANHQGIWAYYPIGNHYKLMSDTITNFIQNWMNNILYV